MKYDFKIYKIYYVERFNFHRSINIEDGVFDFN